MFRDVLYCRTVLESVTAVCIFKYYCATTGVLENRFGGSGKSWNFCKQGSGNPVVRDKHIDCPHYLLGLSCTV